MATKFIIKLSDKNKISEKIKEELERRLDNALNDIADFIGTKADSIVRENSTDTGFLANSLVVDKEQLLHKEVGYSALYAPFIEYGTSPHFPPLDVIYSWLWRKRKDLNIKYTKKKTTILNNKEYNADILKIAWAIAMNMKKMGTEEHPFLRPAFYEGKSKAGEFIKKGMKKG